MRQLYILAYFVILQRLQVSGWAEKHRQKQSFVKVFPAASQCGSTMARQMQRPGGLFAPVSEESADKMINNIKATILIEVFMTSPFSKLLVTLV
jgi:hypothetical protein